MVCFIKLTISSDLLIISEIIRCFISDIYNVFRAINLNKKVQISYISRSSGSSSRVIVPHSIIRTGSFIYVRGFDDKTNEFRSFKLNRIKISTFIDNKPTQNHLKRSDDEWNTTVLITIRINVHQENKEAIEYDYGMSEGKLEVTVKKLLIMFFLME